MHQTCVFKYKYVNDSLEDGVVNIVYVKLAENDGNILEKKNKCWVVWEVLKENCRWEAGKFF